MPAPNFLLLALSAFAQAQAGVVPPAQPNAPPAISSPTPVESTESESFRAATGDLPKAARAARLKNRGEIASHQDYPKEALDQSMQGTTVTRMLVNLDGRVAGCWISKSSGHPVLDAQTCDIVIANAQFEPARDRRGRAVPGLAPLAMTWRLESMPERLRGNINFVGKTTTVVGPGGEVRSCKSEFFFDSRWHDGPTEACASAGSVPPGYWLAMRNGSKLHDAVVVEEVRTLVGSNDPLPALGSAKGELLVVRQSARMIYAPDGKRTSCTMLEQVQTEQFIQLCDPKKEQASPAPPEVLRKNGPTEVRRLMAIYLTGEPE